ncbi:N-acetyltransferase [Kaistia dalseonensis]|uniref:Acetyltransferase n=1 Tax=Kaistia dalseonensis TaxID=410840 RepID=A0ABU0HD62_9HYPH|nr:N-acetyltransferase [Kaistia dalseonensis]MCX5497580.1 N-acetyltransferase [Kaistia dalseonensis]MDQ0440220.1 putative acetyltransferase [Kaistia dalseonensis]
MIIRPETEADRAAISDITKAAFAGHPYSNQTEHRIIDALRAANALTISLVAEDKGEIVGHVAFSPVTIADGSIAWYALGPLSVRPDRQRQGIGTALVTTGLKMLEATGAHGCVLAGDHRYYGRFGFVTVPQLVTEGVPDEHVLARSFDEYRPVGCIAFHPAFFVS